MSKYYITTPIYYINDKPHIGHAYTTIVADIVARYQRMLGNEVFFQVGTDENSQKSVDAAQKAGAEAVQTFVDQMSAVWEQTWDSMNISNTDFIRTTQERHVKAVNEFFKRVNEKGDIYKGEYVGLYCVGCEAFLKQSDLDDDGNCPHHKKAPKEIKEENYFFKLAKYREPLLKYIEENPDFVQPKSRRNEIINYIKDHMEDISISRQSQEWGIPVPIDESQVLYVWFDALLNYLSVIGFGDEGNPEDNKKFEKNWPADLQIVGKDIIKFHCALWPAMLMSAGLDLPKKVYAHGFFTIDGEKMSKSLGNVIDPADVGAVFGQDALRYFLIREIKFGEDGDFSVQKLKQRYNEELGNELGNLVSRVISMLHKFNDGEVPESENKFDAEKIWENYDAHFGQLEFLKVIEIVWREVRNINKYITDKKPWELAKTSEKELKDVLYFITDGLYQIAWLLTPIMPHISDQVLDQLGFEIAPERARAILEIKKAHISQKQKTKKPEILFPKVE